MLKSLMVKMVIVLPPNWLMFKSSKMLGSGRSHRIRVGPILYKKEEPNLTACHFDQNCQKLKIPQYKFLSLLNTVMILRVALTRKVRLMNSKCSMIVKMRIPKIPKMRIESSSASLNNSRITIHITQEVIPSYLRLPRI